MSKELNARITALETQNNELTDKLDLAMKATIELATISKVYSIIPAVAAVQEHEDNGITISAKNGVAEISVASQIINDNAKHNPAFAEYMQSRAAVDSANEGIQATNKVIQDRLNLPASKPHTSVPAVPAVLNADGTIKTPAIPAIPAIVTVCDELNSAIAAANKANEVVNKEIETLIATITPLVMEGNLTEAGKVKAQIDTLKATMLPVPAEPAFTDSLPYPEFTGNLKLGAISGDIQTVLSDLQKFFSGHAAPAKKVKNTQGATSHVATDRDNDPEYYNPIYKAAKLAGVKKADFQKANPGICVLGFVGRWQRCDQ